MEDLNEQIEKLRQNRGRVKEREEYDFYAQPFGEESNQPAQETADDEKKAEGVGGVFVFQLILVLVIAIAYLLTSTFFGPMGRAILLQTKDKSQNDFVFKDKLYDNVGAFLTYINEQAEIAKGTQQTDEDIIPPEELLEKDGENSKETSAVGGEFTPVLNNEVPQNATTASVMVNGDFFFPLKGDYSVSSYYGFRDHPRTDMAEFHTATDIATTRGETIYAVASGIVTESGVDKSLGNYIWIDHGDELYTVYGHCDKVLVKVGQSIIRGTAVAKVGSTGDSTGNHLHFGMKKDGLYFNPGYVFDELFEDAME